MAAVSALVSSPHSARINRVDRVMLQVILALILVQWAYFARTVRGAALVEIRKDYVTAARSLALPGRIVAAA